MITETQIVRILAVVSPLSLLLLWEVCAQLRLIDIRFFPAPSVILTTVYELIESGELWRHFTASMNRFGWGLIFGGVPALVIGVWMGMSKILRYTIEPIVNAIYPIPKTAILPLTLLIFGLGEASKIAIVSIGVFFPIIINSCAGVLQIPKVYFDVGRVYKASPWFVFRTIALPGALPFILTGVRMGVANGIMLIALAEMTGARAGLGFMLWNSWETMNTVKMYAGIFTIASLGITFSLFLTYMEKVFLPWRH